MNNQGSSPARTKGSFSDELKELRCECFRIKERVRATVNKFQVPNDVLSPVKNEVPTREDLNAILEETLKTVNAIHIQLNELDAIIGE